MKTGNLSIRLLFSVMIAVAVSFGQVMEKNETDQTLSPYFFIKGDDCGDDRLPLKSTGARVSIAGVIADVAVHQVYRNEGKSSLEAIYIFPASTRAAVYAMKMTIGERVIIAKVEEREKARQDYEKALEEGRTASLLEQQRANVFQMSVGNILPGDEIIVELKYTELLLAESGIYQFVYPTVVGPRYSNQTDNQAAENDRWVKNPYLHETEAATYDFDIDVTILAGMPIKDILCESHEVDVHYENEDQARIELSDGSEKSGNRDYILKYRLTSDNVEPGLLLYEGEKENFFLLMLQPPKQLDVDKIPPREYIFIVDVSGSMNGFPLDISKKLLRDLISNLTSADRFNVLLFAGGSNLMAKKSLAATETNVNRAIQIINNERGGGGTEILPALKQALALPQSEGFSRTIVIATDGYVSVEKEAFELIRSSLDQANLFSFGIGSSVNRFLIEGMARAGQGDAFIITGPEKAPSVAARFRKYISAPALTDISYDIKQWEVYDIEPLTIPDIFAERPVLLYGKWRGKANGLITVKGKYSSNESYQKRIRVSDYQATKDNQALKYLWARQRIAMLADYNKLSPGDERVKEITTLGLTYNLLTDYTSFIAFDTEVRSDGEKITTVRQPLPLPQGVSDLAIGGHAGIGALYRKASGVAPARMEKSQLLQAETQPADEQEAKASVRLLSLQAAEFSYQQILLSEIGEKSVELLECYQKSAIYGKSGEISMELSVDGSGKIVKVHLVKTYFKDNALIKCLTSIVKSWQLTAPPGKQNEKIICRFKIEM